MKFALETTELQDAAIADRSRRTVVIPGIPAPDAATFLTDFVVSHIRSWTGEYEASRTKSRTELLALASPDDQKAIDEILSKYQPEQVKEKR